MSLEIIYLLAGLAAGMTGGWWLARSRYRKHQPNASELAQKYVTKELYSDTRRELYDQQQQVLRLTRTLAAQEQQNRSLQENLRQQKEETLQLQKQMQTEFRNLANDLLEEKSRKFTQINEERLSTLLAPLRDKISDFRSKLEQTFHEDTRERASLKKEIEQLMRLNQQVSQDALRLTNALKGDSKTQGDWGELQLELILEKAGLEKNVHYSSQAGFNGQGGKAQRPDYIIHLPDNKHLVLDAKVSLTAYESYFNTEDTTERARFLKDHLGSIYRHMKTLSEKNYQQLYQINQPDYVIMFVPLEPALSAALREDVRIFEKCLEKNIVLVSSSTLMATLRTISYLWKQENQNRHVAEIARQSGKLYDKFVGFIEDLQKIEGSLNAAHNHYQQAINKLSQGKGNLVGRAEKLRELGASTAKSIPQELIEDNKEVR
jgi:DNA recombination protein RmuC